MLVSPLTHLFDLHGVPDDAGDGLCGRFVQQMFEHQTGEVAVQTLKAATHTVRPPHALTASRQRFIFVSFLWKTHLVSADELVGEGQARHQASLLQPEDSSEGTREEDSLHGSECHHTLSWSGGTTVMINTRYVINIRPDHPGT